jgi:hypothetical protein
MQMTLQRPKADDQEVATEQTYSVDFFQIAFGQSRLDWQEYVLGDPVCAVRAVGCAHGRRCENTDGARLGTEGLPPRAVENNSFRDLVEVIVDADTGRPHST